MMKTPDEIKKGLECCVDGNVVCTGNCVFDDDVKLGYPDCVKLLMTNAFSYIQQLEADNAQQARCIENLTDKLNALNDELAELQAERDAAVKDCGCFPCQTCEERENGDLCRMCEIEGGYRSFHQWRGVQKEDIDA